ncbi:MAG: hypothetical protein ACLFPN_05535 [Methanomassiliicoccales archaeon]
MQEAESGRQVGRGNIGDTGVTGSEPHQGSGIPDPTDPFIA